MYKRGLSAQNHHPYVRPSPGGGSGLICNYPFRRMTLIILSSYHHHVIQIHTLFKRTQSNNVEKHFGTLRSRHMHPFHKNPKETLSITRNASSPHFLPSCHESLHPLSID